VILKIVPKAGPEMYTGENQQMIAKEEKTEVLFLRLLRIRKCFQRRRQNFSIIFLLQKANLKFKNCSCAECTDLI
jgi:hypothetical protein